VNQNNKNNRLFYETGSDHNFNYTSLIRDYTESYDELSNYIDFELTRVKESFNLLPKCYYNDQNNSTFFFCKIRDKDLFS